MIGPDTMPETTPQTNPGPYADPGSPGLAKLCWVLMVVLLGVVIVFQQTGGSAAAQPKPVAAAIEPPEPDQSLIMAKIAVKFADAAPSEANNQIFLSQIDQTAHTDAERLRAVMIAAHLSGAEVGRERLSKLSSSMPEDSPLREDLATLERLYAEPHVPLTDAEAQRLKDHHGYFGQLAAVFGKEKADPAREALVGGGMLLIGAFAGIGLVVASAMLIGLGLFVTAIVLLALGKLRPRFQPPARGGSVPLELVCVFIGGFACLKLVALAAHALLGPDAAGTAAMIGQWSLLLVVFYPLLRGVRWSQTRDMLGLYARGRGGVLGEVWCGFLGYLAGLPVFLAGALVSVGLFFITEWFKQAAGGSPSAPPENPIIEYFASGNLIFIILLAALATIWAPLVEEIVFRGALLRQFSPWIHPVLAAVPTALVFGFMHNYPVMLLGPVIALGFVFGCIRWWRGSLIACITAHFIHNAFIVAIMITMVTLLG